MTSVILQHERMQVELDEALELGEGLLLFVQAVQVLRHGKGDVTMIEDPARHLRGRLENNRARQCYYLDIGCLLFRLNFEGEAW